LKTLGLLERVFIKDLFENVLKVKDVKEYSVKWTHWDSNRECLKFDKVGKPSSSTIITAIINTSYQENALQQFTLKYITLA